MKKEHKEFINDIKLSVVAGFALNAVLSSEIEDDPEKVADAVIKDIKKLAKKKSLELDDNMKGLIYQTIIIALGLKEELDADRESGEYDVEFL